MKLYPAFDLHSHNSHLGIIDENGKQVHGSLQIMAVSSIYRYRSGEESARDGNNTAAVRDDRDKERAGEIAFSGITIAC